MRKKRHVINYIIVNIHGWINGKWKRQPKQQQILPRVRVRQYSMYWIANRYSHLLNVWNVDCVICVMICFIDVIMPKIRKQQQRGEKSTSLFAFDNRLVVLCLCALGAEYERSTIKNCKYCHWFYTSALILFCHIIFTEIFCICRFWCWCCCCFWLFDCQRQLYLSLFITFIVCRFFLSRFCWSLVSLWHGWRATAVAAAAVDENEQQQQNRFDKLWMS